MRRFIPFCLILYLLFGLSPCYAKWANIPTCDLVRESDLIVVGMLHEVTKFSRDCTEYYSGVLTVQEVLRGGTKPARAGMNYRLRWIRTNCGESVNHSESVNKPLVWILNQGEGDLVSADYPGRVVELARKAEVLHYSHLFPLQLVADAREFVSGEPAFVSLVCHIPTTEQARRAMLKSRRFSQQGKLHVTGSDNDWNPHEFTLDVAPESTFALKKAPLGGTVAVRLLLPAALYGPMTLPYLHSSLGLTFETNGLKTNEIYFSVVSAEEKTANTRKQQEEKAAEEVAYAHPENTPCRDWSGNSEGGSALLSLLSLPMLLLVFLVKRPGVVSSLPVWRNF